MSDIEAEKLRLEERKIAVEERKLEIEQRFFHKHVGVFITALISLAAVLVSGSQVWVANINKNKELALSIQQKAKEQTQTEIENERRWKLDALRFVAANRSVIFSDNLDERRRIRDVMVATLPEEVTNPLFLRLAALSSPDERRIWSEERQELYDSVIHSLLNELEWQASTVSQPDGRGRRLVVRYKKGVPQGKEPERVMLLIRAAGVNADGARDFISEDTHSAYIKKPSELEGILEFPHVISVISRRAEDNDWSSLDSLRIAVYPETEDGPMRGVDLIVPVSLTF